MATTTKRTGEIVCGIDGCPHDVTIVRTRNDDRLTTILECPTHGDVVTEHLRREALVGSVCGVPDQLIGHYWAPSEVPA